MSAQPDEPLILLSELADGTAKAVEVRRGARQWSVIVARQDGEVRAFHNRCPHAGMPLDRPDGAVMFDLLGFLVCSAHLASFRFSDGAYAGGPKSPGGRGLKPAPIRITDGRVWLCGGFFDDDGS